MWQAQFTRTLLSMFSADEFRRFLRWTWPDVEPELPGATVPPATFFAAAVSTLSSRGYVDTELFRALREQRPRRVMEIDGIERVWREAQERGVEVKGPIQQLAPPAPAASSPRPEDASPFRHDVFIAHASPDKLTAERLYDEIVAAGPDLRLFLDSRSIQLGDAWDEVIPKALRASQVIVMLVSERVERAWYARDEVALAIELTRKMESRQKIVPIFLDGRPTGESSIPYGLRILHGIVLPDSSLSDAARQIARLVTQMRT